LREWLVKQGGQSVFFVRYEKDTPAQAPNKPGPKPKSKPGTKPLKKFQSVENKFMPPKSKLYPWEEWKEKLHNCLSKGMGYTLTVQKCGVENVASAANSLKNWLNHFGGRESWVLQYERELGREQVKEEKNEEKELIKHHKTELAQLRAYIVQLESMLEQESIETAKQTTDKIIEIITKR